MNDISRRVYLYGLDNEYHIVRYHYIKPQFVSINEIMTCASRMKRYYPNIRMIFAVDNSFEICQECHNSMKTRSVENRVMFKMMLEERGLRIA